MPGGVQQLQRLDHEFNLANPPHPEFYVPLQMLRAQDPNTFQPKIGFQTRYGMVANPFSNTTGDSDGTVLSRTNQYYCMCRVVNLL